MQTENTVKESTTTAKANKLQFMGVGNFAQHLVYVDEVPLVDMLREGFWSGVVRGNDSDRFKPGDMVTLRQVVWQDMSRDLVKTVLVRADCEVISTNKNGAKLIPLNVWDFQEEAALPVNEDANDSKHAEKKGLKRKWDAVARVHRVFKDDDLVFETKNKAEADAIVAGKQEIPKAA